MRSSCDSPSVHRAKLLLTVREVMRGALIVTALMMKGPVDEHPFIYRTEGVSPLRALRPTAPSPSILPWPDTDAGPSIS